MKLDVSYDCVSLSSALAGRDRFFPDEPIFAADAPIGVKMSICLWVSILTRYRDIAAPLTCRFQIKGVRSPRPLEDVFSSKQYRVRIGDDKVGRPITRARLAYIIALEVFEFMVRLAFAYPHIY